MTVKRTELEILNKAIELAETKTMRINELGRIQKDKEKRIAELLIDIEGFSNQLDLLRWLYKDNSEVENAR